MRSGRNSERGALTLVALCLTAVIGIALGGYIALCYQSLSHGNRQFNLNRARQLAETGIEEALWSLNNNNWTTTSWGSVVDADSDGSNDDRRKTFTGYTFDSGVTGQVLVKVLNYAGNTPTIIATATITTTTSGTFTRTLTATTIQAPLFVNAIGIADGSNGRVLFNSGGVIDSWDSDPDSDYNVGTSMLTYSTPTYAAAVNCAATVAAPNVTLNSATVYGYVSTFGNSIVTTGSSKIKGPGPTAPNIDTTRIGKSAFVPAFTVAVPSSYSIAGYLTGNSGSITRDPTFGGTTTSSSVTIGTANGSTEYWVASSGLLVDNSTITVAGPVVLIVFGDLDMVSNGRININSSGKARLELFVSDDVLIGHNTGSTAGIVNNSNEAKNLVLYSTGLSRDFTYYTTVGFCGVMYSAETNAKVEIASSSFTMDGAILANYNVEFNSGTSPIIHYDLALQNLPKGWFKGVTTPYLVLQITES